MIGKLKLAMTRTGVLVVMAILSGLAALGAGAYSSYCRYARSASGDPTKPNDHQPRLARSSSSRAGTITDGRRTIPFRPHEAIDVSGFSVVGPSLKRWKPDASLETIGESWRGAGYKLIAELAGPLDDARSRKDRAKSSPCS